MVLMGTTIFASIARSSDATFVLGAAAAILLMAVAYRTARRGRNVSLLLGAASVVALMVAIVLAARDAEGRLIWLLAAVPAAIIAQHAFYLYFVRRRALPSELRIAGSGERAEISRLLDPSLIDELPSFSRHFSAELLILRLGVPALVLLGVTLKLGNALADPAAITLLARPDVRHAAAYGLAGAYLYVCMQLGRRAFHSDITPGIAWWSSVTICVGPLLAASLTNMIGAPTADNSKALLYFFAGFAPRLVLTTLETTFRRVYGGGNAPVSTRTIPLRSIRGIDAVVEERLGEEQIYDAHSLAWADPYRLLRNTSYDKGQIIQWIDDAFLVAKVGEDERNKLAKAGITGAIDLAALGLNVTRDAEGRVANPIDLRRVAEIAGTNLELVALTAEQLAQDAQVQRIWMLYQLRGEPGEEEQGLYDALAEQFAKATSANDDEGVRRARAEAAKVAEEKGVSVADVRASLGALADRYERIRATMRGSNERTAAMEQIVAAARLHASTSGLRASDAVEFFNANREGTRIVALAIAMEVGDLTLVPMLVNAIRQSRSLFEQYQALVATRALVARVSDGATAMVLPLAQAILEHRVRATDQKDLSPQTRILEGSDRWQLSSVILRELKKKAPKLEIPDPDEKTN